VALALVLLVGAGLFLKSLARLERINPGFEPHGIMTAAISLPESSYKEDSQQVAFYHAVTEKLANLPGVSSAAATIPLPFGGDNFSSSFQIEGRPQGPADPGPHSGLQAVTPGYFPAMKIALRSGRTFTEQDREGTQPVVMIDDNLARQYWPGQNPLGQRLRRGSNSPWSEIVGVVDHVHQSALAGDSGKGMCYHSLFQMPIERAFLIVRAGGAAASLAGPIREAVRSVAPAQPVYDFATMEQRVAGSLGARRFAVTVLGFFAAVALLMAALGLYGVISYSVTQRTQEIGVRMALGARETQVLALVIGHGMRLVGAGIAIGLIAALSLARLLQSELYQVSPLDPVTFALTATALLFVALLASYLPARRAARIDPIEALRYE
jgi:predicted permease